MRRRWCFDKQSKNTTFHLYEFAKPRNCQAATQHNEECSVAACFVSPPAAETALVPIIISTEELKPPM